MPPTDRSFTSAARSAVEATLARAGLSNVGGGTRNTYFAHLAPDAAGYAVRVGPKAHRIVWRGRGGASEQAIGPERYHGQTDHAALETWARALVGYRGGVAPPPLPEPAAGARRTRPAAPEAPPAPEAAPARAKRPEPGTVEGTANRKAADAFREGAPDFSELRVASADLDVLRGALDAAALALPEGAERVAIKVASETAAEIARDLDKLDAAIDDVEAWAADAADRYAIDTTDARAAEGVIEALAAVLPLGVWADALAAGARGDSVGVLRALAGKF